MINPYDIKEEDVIIDGATGEELVCLGFNDFSVELVNSDGDFIEIEYEDAFWKDAEFSE